MIKESDRIKDIKPYYFATKLAEVRAMSATGDPVINLGIGSPDLPPHESVVDSLSDAAVIETNHGYQSYAGLPELRVGFADWYDRYFGVKADPDTEILPLIGSKEGVMHISMSFINPGDEVLVPNPGYPAYAMSTKLAGGVVRTFDLCEDSGWLPDFETLEQKDLSKVKIMWLNYPNMPTGAVADRKLFEQVVTFGKKHNILICHDNPYSFILTEDRMSIMAVKGAKDTALELVSMSKNYNMAGWRIGAIHGSAAIVKSILKFKSNMDSGMFKPLQLAAVQALSLDDSWTSKLNDVYLDRKKYAIQIMNMLGCTCDENAAGLFVWGKVPYPYEEAEQLTEEILHSARVFITPGHIFGSQGTMYIRISLCADVEQLKEAKQRILSSQNLIV